VIVLIISLKRQLHNQQQQKTKKMSKSISNCLVVLSELREHFNDNQRSTLKQMALTQNVALIGAVDAYQATRDVEDFKDTCQTLLSLDSNTIVPKTISKSNNNDNNNNDNNNDNNDKFGFTLLTEAAENVSSSEPKTSSSLFSGLFQSNTTSTMVSSNQKPSFKVLIVGDGGVGKTCFVKRMKSVTFFFLPLLNFKNHHLLPFLFLENERSNESEIYCNFRSRSYSDCFRNKFRRDCIQCLGLCRTRKVWRFKRWSKY
jgi:hypothetical protein